MRDIRSRVQAFLPHAGKFRTGNGQTCPAGPIGAGSCPISAFLQENAEPAKRSHASGVLPQQAM